MEENAQRDFTIDRLYYSVADFTVSVTTFGGMYNLIARDPPDWRPETRYREAPKCVCWRRALAAKLDMHITRKP
ncbi:hypothetical protein ACNKHQ_00835 [Shigella flexneri]